MTPDVGPPWPCVLVNSARPDGDRGRNQTQSLDIGDSRRGASMALAFSSTPLAPTELEDATTRPSRPQLNFAWPRATRSATTSLGPEQLARPRIYLAPSNSLGHDVDFTWPRATRSAMPPLLPATSMQLAQPPLRDRSAPATSPASSSITPDLPLWTSSNSLSLRFLQLQTHSDTATIPQVRL